MKIITITILKIMIIIELIISSPQTKRTAHPLVGAAVLVSVLLTHPLLLNQVVAAVHISPLINNVVIRSTAHFEGLVRGQVERVVTAEVYLQLHPPAVL